MEKNANSLNTKNTWGKRHKSYLTSDASEYVGYETL